VGVILLQEIPIPTLKTRKTAPVCSSGRKMKMTQRTQNCTAGFPQLEKSRNHKLRGHLLGSGLIEMRKKERQAESLSKSPLRRLERQFSFLFYQEE